MSIRLRVAKRRHTRHIIGFGVAGLLGFVALLIVALAFSLSSLVSTWLEDIPDLNQAGLYVVSSPTTVVDSRGQTIAEYYDQNRKIVDLNNISPYVIAGTVDTEDIRFYQHNGIDPSGIVRAALVTAGGGQEGASTITQQLVRNTVLSDEQFDISLKRKVREAYLAIQMEKKYNKDQILNMYLNTIYYGNSAYGIEAAANTYYNKNAKDLTLSEAALLVGIPNSPHQFDPFVHPEAALQRRNLVLDRMVSAKNITQEEADAAKAEGLNLVRGEAMMSAEGTYPYWTQYIKGLLGEDLSTDLIMRGGLKVYTTLDADAQQAAEKAVKTQLDKLGVDGLESALVAIDPATGYIKAMVGGKDYTKRQINLATQGMRQPGSAFKMFTLSDAISQGMNPNIALNCNSPLRVSPTWTVKNYGGTSYGTISLARATAVSANTGYVQVAQAIGAKSIVNMAHSMGIKEELPEYDSITLGTINIPVIQMAEAYATLPAGGVHRDAVAITKIEDRNGNVVYQHKDSSNQALSAEEASAVTSVLQGVVTSEVGTANVLNNYNISQPIAGKTGTTEYADNLWFCGYTPQIAVAVWTGYPDSSQKILIGGSEGHPSNTSCPIFGMFVEDYVQGLPREEWPSAGTPTYKADSSWTFVGSSSGGGSGGASGEASSERAGSGSYTEDTDEDADDVASEPEGPSDTAAVLPSQSEDEDDDY